MQVVVLGQGARAAAHCAWYARTGVTVLPVAAEWPVTGLPPADLYHLSGEAPELARDLRAALRRRRVAVLVAGRLSADPAEALRLAHLAGQRRSAVAVTGGWRWVPAFARLREQVAGGTLGGVRRVAIGVQAAPERLDEVQWAALDLGWWLAGDGVLDASAGAPGGSGFRAGTAEVTVARAPAGGGDESRWTVELEAEFGQATATAVFVPWLPGSVCRQQSAAVVRAGRRRELVLPAADPVAGELAAVLARQAAGQPWLGVCLAARAAALSALQGHGDQGAAGKTLSCG